MTGHHEFEIDKKSDIWVRKEHATFDSSLDNPWVMFNHSSVPKTCGMHHDITLRQTQRGMVSLLEAKGRCWVGPISSLC